MDTIIICPNSIKNKLLLSKNIYDNICFLSKEDLITGLSFSYSINALYQVSIHFNETLDNSKELMEALKYYPLMKTSSNNNLKDYLFKIYDFLIENNLLIINKHFPLLFNNKKIIIYGYSKLDLELKSYLSLLNVNYEYEKTIDLQKEAIVYSFRSIDEEVKYVFNKIVNLINHGVSPNNIYLYPYSSDYDLIIDKYVHYFNLPFVSKITKLYDLPSFKEFLLKYEESDSDIISFYNEYEIKNTIIKNALKELIVNIKTIDGLNKKDEIILLKFLSKEKQITLTYYEEEIKKATSFSIINPDEYLFILGFSNDTYPTVYLDNDLLSDEYKKEIGLNDSFALTNLEKTYLSRLINTTTNITITYKEVLGKKEYYIPSFIPLKIVKVINDNKRYSLELSELEVAICKDRFKLYGDKSIYLNAFTDEELGYNTYNHQYKQVNAHIDNLVLSYTQINEYNKCPFMYYIKRILKANIFEDRFETTLGNCFHKLLEQEVKENREITDNDIDIIIKESFKTKKDIFYGKRLLPQVLKVIDKNNKFKEVSLFNDILVEEEIKTNIDEKTILTGKIDKVLLDNHHKLILLVDYKSGNFSFDIMHARHGVDMQLPIYEYLIKSKYKDYETCGIYIQNICIKDEYSFDESYKLDGITLNDPSIIELIDKSSLENKKSIYIKDVKKTSSTLKSKDSNTKSLFKELEEIAKREINKVNQEIRKNNFTISPVRFNNDDRYVCSTCPCLAICYRDYNDIRDINLKEEENEAI